MHPTRREMLRLGLGTSALLACGPTVPMFLARSAGTLADERPAGANGRALVVVQLDGGNDGLNTVVPYRDDAYRKAMASRDDRHWVYKREGLPCRVCGTNIVMEELGGRKLYWCPVDQA